MNVLLFCLIVLLSKPIWSEENVKSLCEDPIIDAADRLANGSVRVYRKEYYWELEGLPNKVTVAGPFKVWYNKMLPIDRSTVIMTVITGKDKTKDEWTAVTYKFFGNRWRSWKDNGQQKGDDSWGQIPKGGWNAAFNDANMDDNKKYPMMIAFRPTRVDYFNTGGFPFQRDGNRDGYNMTGQFNEQFPSDLTSAVAIPSSDPKYKYFVYLFRVGKYCYRPINGNKEEKDCETKWRHNEELFGCTLPANPGKADPLETQSSSKGPDSTVSTISTNSSGLSIKSQDFKVILIVITFLSFCLI